jgi:hypothetical protein
MPRQQGPVYYTGTRGDLCFYEMDGKHLVRRKSTLSGKRVKHDPAFALTRVYADLMAQASRIASAVYRTIPRHERQHVLYLTMTGAAQRMLKQGVMADEISSRLQQAYLQKGEIQKATADKDGAVQDAAAGMPAVTNAQPVLQPCAMLAVAGGIAPAKASITDSCVATPGVTVAGQADDAANIADLTDTPIVGSMPTGPANRAVLQPAGLKAGNAAGAGANTHSEYLQPVRDKDLLPGAVTVIKLRDVKKHTGTARKKRIFVRLPKQVSIHITEDGQMEIGLTKRGRKKGVKGVFL